jgi:hypothetical protein
MPGVQIFAFRQPPVGTGFGQPAQAGYLLRGQDQTVGNQDGPVAVIGTTACLDIEQVAGNPGVGHLSRFAILKFLQTAAAAAIAQGLPLFRLICSNGHRLPERLSRPSDGRVRSIGFHAGMLILYSLLSGRQVSIPLRLPICTAARNGPIFLRFQAVRSKAVAMFAGTRGCAGPGFAGSRRAPVGQVDTHNPQPMHR